MFCLAVCSVFVKSRTSAINLNLASSGFISGISTMSYFRSDPIHPISLPKRSSTSPFLSHPTLLNVFSSIFSHAPTLLSPLLFTCLLLWTKYLHFQPFFFHSSVVFIYLHISIFFLWTREPVNFLISFAFMIQFDIFFKNCTASSINTFILSVTAAFPLFNLNNFLSLSLRVCDLLFLVHYSFELSLK